MKLTALSVIFSLFIVGLYAAATDLPSVATSTELPSAVDKKTTTVAPTTEEPITVAPTSSSTTEASTTQAPTKTTSTTPKPTPEPTPAPTTPTTVAPKTTPAPTPAPVIGKPEEAKYVVTEGNTSCILVQFATQLNVSYTDANNDVQYKIYNLPGDGDKGKFKEAKGKCGKDTQFIVIEWFEANQTNTFNLTFGLIPNTTEFGLIEAVFNLSSNIVPTSSKDRLILYHVGNTFIAPKDKSYHCTRVQSLNLTDTNIVTNTTIPVGTVSVSSVLLEAFHKGDNQDFSSAIDCDAINTPDIVPIAVGIALIALVVVVLIAYLVGRRRAAARGYVSM